MGICGTCPWRRDSRAGNVTSSQINRMRSSCGQPGAETALDAPMIACRIGPTPRPCAGWLAAHGADHLRIRVLVATGQLDPVTLRPQPGDPDLYGSLDDLSRGHTGSGLDDLDPDENDPALDVHDPTGKARLMSRQCDTCILRPGDPMHLGPTYLRQFLTAARSSDSFVICHETLPGMPGEHLQPAICRGFHDRYTTSALTSAATWGFQQVDPPSPVAETGR